MLRPNVLAGVIVVAIALSSVASAEPLAYRWQPGQKFSYQVEIVVDGDEIITYKGIIHYTVNTASDEAATVTYRGGLVDSRKSKQRVVRPGFGPGFRPPAMPSPFSKPAFSGKRQTTNKLTITSRGQTLALQGDSQLPYLLGNVSLMPFEPLPEGDKKSWSLDSGVSITEERENDRRPFGPFGPIGPFGGMEQTKVQAAGEESNYSIESEQGDLVTVKKTYRLYTPTNEEQTTFEMVGGGTWTFDRKENVPQAYDMDMSLKVTKGNTTTTLPITIKYDRLSQEKLAEIEAAAKKRADEIAKAAEERRAAAARPLSDSEKSEVLATLAADDSQKIGDTLRMLAGKSPADPDAEIVQAIEPHLTSTDRRVAMEAERAMTKWSPAYATRKKLEKDYQGPGSLKSTGLAVDSTTDLFVGQIVQAQRPRRGPFWRAAKVKSLLSNGQVELAFLTWGQQRDRDVDVVKRTAIQLAPPELPQPARPASSPAPTAADTQSRTWTDSTGKFKVQGEFIEVVDGNVLLRRADGRTLTIPLDKLSDADQARVRQLQSTEPDNPFQLK